MIVWNIYPHHNRTALLGTVEAQDRPHAEFWARRRYGPTVHVQAAISAAVARTDPALPAEDGAAGAELEAGRADVCCDGEKCESSVRIPAGASRIGPHYCVRCRGALANRPRAEQGRGA